MYGIGLSNLDKPFFKKQGNHLKLGVALDFSTKEYSLY